MNGLEDRATVWDRKRKIKRYLIVALLIIITAAPSIMMLPILGSLNLLFLLILWPLFLVIVKILPKRFLLLPPMFFAIAMAIPPYPYYFSITDEGHPSFGFIGFKNIFDDLYGLVFFFIFYFAIFVSVAFLINPRKAQ